jgi:hypothetical protein
MLVDPTMMVDSFDLSFHVEVADQLVILVLECNQCKTKSIQLPPRLSNVFSSHYLQVVQGLSSNSDWPQWDIKRRPEHPCRKHVLILRSKDTSAQCLVGTFLPAPLSRCGDAASCGYLSKSTSHMRRLRET